MYAGHAFRTNISRYVQDWTLMRLKFLMISITKYPLWWKVTNSVKYEVIWKCETCQIWSTNWTIVNISENFMARGWSASICMEKEGGWIGVCKSADPCLFFAKSVHPPKFLSETTTTSGNRSVKVKGKLVNVNAIVNFAQIVKKATSLMTITQYNSRKRLMSESKFASFEKKLI